MRHHKVLVSLIVASLLAATVEAGDPLTVEQLKALQKAGLKATDIVALVERDGVAFEPSASVVLDLKSAGLPVEVLSTIARSRPPRGQSDAIRRAQELIASDKRQDALPVLESEVEKHPQDFRARALLVVTLLKLDQRAEADKQLIQLKGMALAPEDAGMVKRLEDAVASLDREAAFRQELVDALYALDAGRAVKAVDALSASVEQKAILRAFISSYQGRFDEAIATISSIQPTRPSDNLRLDEIKREFATRKGQYEEARARRNAIVFSPEATGCWWLADVVAKIPEMAGFPLAAYFGSVDEASRLAPVATDVLDDLFLIALTTGDYATLDGLGTRILAATGTLRIPYYTEKNHGLLAVDGRARKIVGQLLPTPMHSFSASGLTFSFSWKPTLGNKACAANAPPFEARFDDLGVVKQEKGLFKMLSLEPKGSVPSIALVGSVSYFFGQRRGVEVGANLVRFLAKTINRPSLKVTLQDPTKTGGSGLGKTLGLVATAGLITMGGRAAGQSTADATRTAVAMVSDVVRLDVAQQTADAKGNAQGALNFRNVLVQRAVAAASLGPLFSELEDILGIKP